MANFRIRVSLSIFLVSLCRASRCASRARSPGCSARMAKHKHYVLVSGGHACNHAATSPLHSAACWAPLNDSVPEVDNTLQSIKVQPDTQTAIYFMMQQGRSVQC